MNVKDFIKVNKKQYENFFRFFKDRISGNFCMDCSDLYDWSLDPDYKKSDDIDKICKHCDKCHVARHECYPDGEYYIRKDYIEANRYDINTIVPVPPKPKLSKTEQMMVDAFCKVFDQAFREECFKNDYVRNEPSEKAVKAFKKLGERR